MTFNLKNENRLEEYTLFLDNAFSKGFWDGQAYNGQRIYWNDAKKAKYQIVDFNKAGIYIWGYSNKPMYIGKAENQTIAKRFNRYTFGKRAQYQIATNYWKHLNEGGKKKEIDDLIVENGLSLKHHRSRCRQAKAFGEKMTDNAWFLFMALPIDEIHELEYELISAGNKYNAIRNLDPLLNKVKNQKNNKRSNAKYTVVFSHGKEGTPNGTKSKLIENCTKKANQKFISLDYRECKSVEDRVLKLENTIKGIDHKVILVGSSMGGYVSTVVANTNRIDGMYLIAPALYMNGYEVQEYQPMTNNITVRHGWNDKTIPFKNSVKFGKENNTKLELVADNHRMTNTISDLKKSFTLFLKSM